MYEAERVKEYPYCCAFLWYLIQVEYLTGTEVHNRIVEYIDWLNVNCRALQEMNWEEPDENGKYPVILKPAWEWSTLGTMLPLHYNIFSAVPAGFSYSREEEREFPNAIYFKNKEDLLAFKIRFGVNDTVGNPR